MFKLNDDYPVTIKLRIMAGQIFAAAEIGMWCFASDQKLYYTTCPNEVEVLSFLQLGGCMEYAFSRKEGWEKPVFLSDQLGMGWIAESVIDDFEDQLMIIVGPFFLNHTSMKRVEAGLRKQINSVKLLHDSLRLMSQIPVITTSVAYQFASMLHYTITDCVIREPDFYFQQKADSETVKLVDYYDEDYAAVPDQNDRAVDWEMRLMEAIKTGNLSYTEILKGASNYRENYLTDTKDTLRDGKNTMIIFNALCNRASIEGGISIRTAREIEHSYMEKIEASETISQLQALKNKMLEEYVNRVREIQDHGNISKEIQGCMDYIKTNLQKSLDVDEIAGLCGYTTYYFTKKFYKEVGVRVTDYIKQARIEYAKIALISTQKSIQDISDALQFGNRNYFSRVFREVVGMTPAAYRERMGR
ncbi:helix-turn-helix transcriptional regulator [Faecalicatena orotica]|uniref:helix-turn-helix transcriptional regulator n=1 Tax=Faecalicatena orotica TaxID=1544 RepID=UPI003216E230